jgi:hypothetical protein
VERIAAVTATLLAALPKRGDARTREGEREAARLRGIRRERLRQAP